jgi:hypothetical protein
MNGFICVPIQLHSIWQLTIADCLRLAPFLTRTRASSLLLWRTKNSCPHRELPWTMSVSRSSLIHFWISDFTSEFTASESESELLYDWRFTANQFVLATSPLSPTTRNFIFQLSTCGCSPYVTSSLTRGWVCRLQLLLVLASAGLLFIPARLQAYESPP